MTITAAAKKHLAVLAERGVKAEKKVKDGKLTTKTATKRKPRKAKE